MRIAKRERPCHFGKIEKGLGARKEWHCLHLQSVTEIVD
jgi:hypothetical protein